MKLLFFIMSRYPQFEKIYINDAIRKSGLPKCFSDDAAQEIRLAWLSNEINTRKYDATEILSYATKIAFTAALKLRRELSGPVAIPKTTAKSCKTDPKTYVSTTFQENDLEQMPLYWSDDAELENTSDDQAAADKEDFNKTVLELAVEGESTEAIAEIKSRSVRWVRDQFNKMIQEADSHATA